MVDLVCALKYDFESLADGIISCGFGDTAPTDDERAFFKPQILKCDSAFLGKLMEDHGNTHSLALSWGARTRRVAPPAPR